MQFSIFPGTFLDHQSNCGRLYIPKMPEQYFSPTCFFYNVNLLKNLLFPLSGRVYNLRHFEPRRLETASMQVKLAGFEVRS